MTRRPSNKTNRLALVKDAALASGLPQSTCHWVLHRFLEEIVNHVSAGRKVHLRGLGTFYSKTRAPQRGGRNPKTGEPAAMLPQRRVMLARVRV